MEQPSEELVEAATPAEVVVGLLYGLAFAWAPFFSLAILGLFVRGAIMKLRGTDCIRAAGISEPTFFVTLWGLMVVAIAFLYAAERYGVRRPARAVRTRLLARNGSLELATLIVMISTQLLFFAPALF